MTIPRNRILLVGDEPKSHRSLRTTLIGLGFEISEAAGGEEAFSFVRARHFDAVLLEIDMPASGGLETCRRIRRHSMRIPILIATIRASTECTVTALEAGADYCLAKPLNSHELIAYLRASIRRSQLFESAAGEAAMKIRDIRLDPECRLLLKAGRPIHLTPKEFDLLRFLMSHAGKTVPHWRLLNSVWGIEYGSELEYLRTFMHQLRKKLEDDPAKPKYLLTDPYVGYRFAA